MALVNFINLFEFICFIYYVRNLFILALFFLRWITNCSKIIFKSVNSFLMNCILLFLNGCIYFWVIYFISITCLFLYYLSILNIIAFYKPSYLWKQPFKKIVLANLISLFLHMNLRISFLSYMIKLYIGILIGNWIKLMG